LLSGVPAGQQPADASRPAPAGQAAPGRPDGQAQGQPPSTTPGAAQDAQQPAQPVFRTGINFVSVDVIITDKKGVPVTDLQVGDFEVFEDGKPQAVETFKRIDVTGQPAVGGEVPRQIRTAFDEESEAQREDVRIFVFMLDDYHVRRANGMRARESLVRFVREQLGPLDLVGLMYPLTPVTDLHLHRNRDGLIREIERFDGRKGDYLPRNDIEEQYAMYPVEVVERVRNEVSLSALEGLMVKLAGVREGRKQVVLMSEGYTNYVPPQMRDPNAMLPGVNNPNRGRVDPVQGYGDDRARFFGDMDIQSRIRDIFNAANRGNTAIYALDPRGLAVFEYDIQSGIGLTSDSKMLNQTMDTLRVLAEETDGRAIVNRNDLDAGLRQIVRDASAYYLLGYNSTQAPADGKFHEIKVKVKRPGLQVRARKGYWALTAADFERATAPPAPEADPALGKALAAVEAPRRARLVRTWIGTAPAESGKTRVSFVWEPVPALPGERSDTPARLGVVAAGDTGMYYRGKVGTDPGSAAVPASSGGRAGRVEFEAPPGKLQLRLSIEDAAGEVIDSDLLDVQVPDYATTEVRLTPLEVLRARGAIEFRALNADPAAMPVAAREFSRTERLLIRFAALGPGGTAPETVVRLLNRAGTPMSTLPAQAAPGDDPARRQVDLPLAGLAAGDYLVEVVARSGESEAKQLVGFRVTS
jgi:VWFA-related protein